MSVVNIEVHDSCDTPHNDVLLAKLSAFNRRAVPSLPKSEDGLKFSVFAVSDADYLLGGLTAHCYWNTVHIELLWVDESARGTGIGAGLIEQCEARARQNGCNKAYVETLSWQAKPFYERQGFTLMGTFDDRPVGHATHYLTKTL